MKTHSSIQARGAAVMASLALAWPTAAMAVGNHSAAHNPSVPKPDSAICTSLAADYETASKKLALSAIEAEEHRPGAQTDDAAVVNQATMTMSLMQAHGCKLPASAPSSDRYAKNAIMCALTENVNATKERADEALANYPGGSPNTNTYDAPECDMSKWRPDGVAK